MANPFKEHVNTIAPVDPSAVPYHSLWPVPAEGDLLEVPTPWAREEDVAKRIGYKRPYGCVLYELVKIHSWYATYACVATVDDEDYAREWVEEGENDG